MHRSLLIAGLVFAFLLPALLSCSNGPSVSVSAVTRGKGPITVGSKIDTEGGLLAQMIIIMLRASGFDVVDRSQTGPTQVVRKALFSGQIDVYPEYTGNGAFFFKDADPEIWKDARRGYDEIKRLDNEANHFVWLRSAPANNTWAIAVPKSLAEKEGIGDMAAFAAYVNRGGAVKLASSPAFATSPVALPAFQKAYSFTLRDDQLLTLPGSNTEQTEKAAADGTDGVNAAMAYGTDGLVSALDLVILEDPRGAQPVYEPAPIVRSAVYDKYPEIANILDPVFQSLDLKALQALNAKIGVHGQDPSKVAGDYLREKGFLK